VGKVKMRGGMRNGQRSKGARRLETGKLKGMGRIKDGIENMRE